MQKERFKTTEYFFDLSQEQCKTVVKTANKDEDFETYITKQFDHLENRYGKKGFSRLATYITCSEYGLTETEHLELLMPIHNSDAWLDTNNGEFNFSTFKSIRNEMSE